LKEFKFLFSDLIYINYGVEVAVSSIGRHIRSKSMEDHECERFSYKKHYVGNVERDSLHTLEERVKWVDGYLSFVLVVCKMKKTIYFFFF
jgi:hypothetical protein